jgi:hypothetical protein
VYRSAVGGGASFDADAQAIIDNMTALPDATLQDHIKQLVKDLKNGQINGSNVWGKTDCCLAIKFPNATDGLRYLNAPTSTATAVNSPVFLANRYYKGNGTNARIDTFNPTTLAGNWARNSACLAVGVRTVDSDSGFRAYSAAATSGDTSTLVQIGRSITGTPWNAQGPQRGNNTGYTTNGENADGLLAANRSGSAATQAYRNGTLEASGTETSGSLLNATIPIFSRLLSGSHASYSDFECDFFWAGASLTANEHADLYDAYNRWKTAREAVP